MKVALITGITGMDAANLANYLLSLNYTVIGTERRVSTPNRWRLDELGITNHPNLKIVSADLLDQGSLDRIMVEYKPDEVYNLAAQSFVGASWQNPILTSEITGLGATRVFESVRNHAPNAKIYQASSSEVIGGANRHVIFNEETSFQPRSPYGVAKAYAHYMAINYRESYDMFISVGLLANHEGPLRGIEFVTRKVTDAVARISLGLQSHLTLQNLDSVRDWGDSRDFIVGMHKMLQHDKPEDFVLATNKVHSIADLCETAFNMIGIPTWRHNVILSQSQRPADIKYLQGDYSKAKNVLGWEPKIPFKHMIREMVEADLKRVNMEKERA